MDTSTTKRLLRFDSVLAARLSGLLAGVDEAGRGPLAGPVVAAAVIFIRKTNLFEILAGLNDSKQLSAKRREVLFQVILEIALIGIGVVDEEEIDRLNIYQASRLAMKQAVLSLSRTPDLILIDGNAKIDLPLAQQTVVGGDGKSAVIAAASIVAKVYRDAWMRHLDTLYPEYDFKAHKGYPTPRHLKAIDTIGPSPVHRKSFSPVNSFFPEKVCS